MAAVTDVVRAMLRARGRDATVEPTSGEGARSGRWRTVLGVVAAVLVGAVVGLGVMWLRQDALIYHPTAAPPSPERIGLPEAEPLTVPTADGLELAAWFVPARGETVGAVLVLHGNGGNRADRAPLAAALRDRGLATLLLDYRGFGGSPGDPSQEGLLRDAHAGLDALQRRTGFDRGRIVYFGESLGSAIAAGLAAERPAAGVILRSPFPSLADVGRLHFSWLPVNLLLRDRYPTADWIAAYDGPTLIIAGGRDTLVPTALSTGVADVAPGAVEPLVIAGADHNDLALLAGDTMLEGIMAFLRDPVGLPVPDVPAD
jgi:fermentation-respiration switch protein FrsA (DUF1100 family)